MKQVIIKKYGNRRLYNTAESRYVNLDEVAQMIRDGLDVRVVDANSEKISHGWFLPRSLLKTPKCRNRRFLWTCCDRWLLLRAS